MSEYKDTIITNQGLILADKASHGLASFQIKRATGSETDLSSLSDSQVQDLSNIEEDDKTGVLVDTGREEDETLAETVVSFDNQNLSKGYFLRTIGLWATDNNGKEILYSVTRAITPEYIPDFNKKNLLQFKINVQIIVGNRANVEITLNPDSMATIGYANKIVEKAKSDLVGSLQSYYVDKQSNQDITGIKNFNNGLKVDNQDVYVQDDKLMYNDKPVLVANAPNAPKLELSVDKNTNDIQYKILPPSISGGAEITGYNLYYKKSSDYQWQNKQLDKNDLVGQFPGEKSATYQAQVQAKNYAGDSVKSDIYSILSADVPTVTGIDLNYIDDNTASYKISANDNGANINLYRIYYKKQSDSNWTSFVNESDKSSIILEYGEHYNFKIVAQNAVGFSNNELKAEYQNVNPMIFSVTLNSSISSVINSANNINNLKRVQYNGTVTDKYNNTFLRFYKCYFHKYRDSNQNVVYEMSQVKHNNNWYLPKCFYDFENNKELDYVDISKNHNNVSGFNGNNVSGNFGNGYYFSSSLHDVINKLNTTDNNNNSYNIIDYHTLDFLITLMIFKNKSSYSINNSLSSIGTLGFTPISTWPFVDGANIDGSYNIWVCDNPTQYKEKTFAYPYYLDNFSLLSKSGINNSGDLAGGNTPYITGYGYSSYYTYLVRKGK